MRHFLLTLAALAFVTVHVPSVMGEGPRLQYHFTSDPLGPGVFELARSQGGSVDRVELGNGQPVRWQDPTVLRVAAPVDEHAFNFTLFFASSGGKVVVTLGYEKDDSAHVVGSDVREVRNAGEGRESGGRADGSVTASGPIPAGSQIFVRLQTSKHHELITDESTFATAYGSTASVPLPELSSIALTGLGFLAIAVVARVRRT